MAGSKKRRRRQKIDKYTVSIQGVTPDDIDQVISEAHVKALSILSTQPLKNLPKKENDGAD